MKTFILEITTWAGVSLGAEHYYGCIKDTSGDNRLKDEKVMKPLTAHEAAKLNKKDHYMSGSNKPGDLDPRFETREQVIKWALKWFRENHPDDILLLKRWAVWSPGLILHSPLDNVFVQRMNALLDIWEFLDDLKDECVYISPEYESVDELQEEIGFLWYDAMYEKTNEDTFYYT